jgi:hypothetical protein
MKSGCLQKSFAHFVPVVEAVEVIQMDIMRRGKDEFFAIELFEIVNQVVNHIIAVHHGFASTKDDLLPTQKWKMFVDPRQFFRQRLWEFHGSGDDENLILFIQRFHYLAAALVDGHVFEKIFLIGKPRDAVVVVRETLTFALAIEDGPVDPDAKLLFIIVDKLSGGIRHHIIHVDDQSFHMRRFVIFPEPQIGILSFLIQLTAVGGSTTLKSMQEKEDNIIVFKHFDNAIDANIAKTKLDAYGIPCFLTEENMANLYPGQSLYAFKIRLHLFEADRERASHVLMNENRTSDEEGVGGCPKCHSGRVTRGFPRKIADTLGIALFGIFLPHKKVNQCLDCGFEF